MLENPVQELSTSPVLAHAKQKKNPSSVLHERFFIIKDSCYNYYAIGIKDANNNEKLGILVSKLSKNRTGLPEEIKVDSGPIIKY